MQMHKGGDSCNNLPFLIGPPNYCPHLLLGSTHTFVRERQRKARIGGVITWKLSGPRSKSSVICNLCKLGSSPNCRAGLLRSNVSVNRTSTSMTWSVLELIGSVNLVAAALKNLRLRKSRSLASSNRHTMSSAWLFQDSPWGGSLH